MIKTSRFLFLAFLILIIVGFAVLSYMSLVIFRDYPFCMDEYSCLYQAKIFASGHFYFQAPAHTENILTKLLESHMRFFNGRIFSEYPPGFPFILALAVKFWVPGLINPVLSILTILVIYLMGVQLSGALFALLAVLMMVSNSYFLGYGASYFSQPLSLFLTSLSFFFYLKFKTKRNEMFLNATALSVGLLMLVRPLDALCLWIAVGIALRTDKEKKIGESLKIFVLLPALGVVILLGYNKILTDHVSLSTFPIFFRMYSHIIDYRLENNLMVKAGIILGHYFVNLKECFWLLFTRYFLGYFVFWIPLFLLSFIKTKEQSQIFRDFRRIFFIYSFLLVALYNFQPKYDCPIPGWPQYGSRYWYPLIVPMALMLTEGLRVL
ncbi:MAG: hypothetical protein WCH62_03315, partial [Candidatus Omnitrophota bacterium]